MKSNTLQEFCLESGVYGIPAAAEDYDEKKFRYLRISDISDDGVLLNNDKRSISDPESKKYLLSEDDIVFARTGNSTGRTYFYDKRDGELIFAGFLIRYKLDDKKINPKYLKYFTLSKQYKSWIDNFSIGSTRGNMSAEDYSNMPLIVPERAQQDLLVKVLDSITDKISLNNKINSELEESARTLYNYWFVQFDFPDEQGNPYRTSGGKMKYNEVLKREIPNGWGIKRLKEKEVATLIMGQSPKSESYNTEHKGIPLVNGAADYKNGLLLPNVYTTAPTRVCLKNDMVFCIRATIGNLTFAEDSFCLGRGVAAVRPSSLHLTELLYFHLLQEIERFKKQATGSIIKGITKDDLSDSFIILPSDDTILKFHSLLSPFFAKQRIINLENQKLSELRDWLLPMLMNGQIKAN
jgi:type I restriction enzyme S subunit